MNVAMARLDSMMCLVYLDDIIVHFWNMSAHLDRLRLLLGRLLVTGLKLKVSKCRLLWTEVDFLGYRISTQDMAPDPGRIDAPFGSGRPHSLTDVRASLGLCSCYRKFLGISHI